MIEKDALVEAENLCQVPSKVVTLMSTGGMKPS